MLPIPDVLDAPAMTVATYITAALRALARDEHVGRRPHRLLEPWHATWQRFRMGPRELVLPLLEDAAVTHLEPFAMTRCSVVETKARSSCPAREGGPRRTWRRRRRACS